MTAAIWRIPRESIEWVGPITMTGTGALTVALVPDDARPTPADWQPPTVLDGERGVLVGGLEVGVYRLWAKVSDTPETPVFSRLAYIYIT